MATLQQLEYSALERVKVAKPVDRLDYLAECVRGLQVFDFGALDETAYQTKRDGDSWLHARLCATAARVTGFDNSSLIPTCGLRTGPNGLIVSADIFDLGPAIERFGRPDVIVAGELIEHLPDTSSLFHALCAEPRLSGVEFIFSTPNACSWHNVFLGAANCESTHQDHLQIYSYKTLRTLTGRSGLVLEDLQPYYARFPEMLARSTGLKRVSVSAFQALVNCMERAFPLLSAGWIGRTRIQCAPQRT